MPRPSPRPAPPRQLSRSAPSPTRPGAPSPTRPGPSPPSRSRTDPEPNEPRVSPRSSRVNPGFHFVPLGARDDEREVHGPVHYVRERTASRPGEEIRLLHEAGVPGEEPQGLDHRRGRREQIGRAVPAPRRANQGRAGQRQVRPPAPRLVPHPAPHGGT